MKTASPPDSPVVLGTETGRGFVERLLGILWMLARVVREQADSFPAIGLAEGGDTEGAAELLARSVGKKP